MQHVGIFVKKGPQQQANNVSFIMSYKVGHHGPEKKKLKTHKKEEYYLYILRTMPVELGSTHELPVGNASSCYTVVR